MRRENPPFRAEHVGSLLRPAHLVDVREQKARGEVDAETLREAEDAAIREVVAMQEAVGLKAVTDGELRRDYWHLDFLCGLEGVEQSDEYYGMWFSGGNAVPTTYVSGPIRYPEGGIMIDHFEFLMSVTGATAKYCLPVPSMLHLRPGRAGISESVYPDLEGFWDDLGVAYNAAVLDLAGRGCRYLQLDNVSTCYLCDETQRQRIRDRGEDPDALLETYIAANNRAVAGRPSDMVVATHLCRGNYRSQWMAQGGYDPIAEKMLNTSDVDVFFLEYDSERAGSFEPLRFLPAGKTVVLGLITTKSRRLEDEDALKRRIEDAARHVPLEQLALSPQCGFASTHHGNRLGHEAERRKLDLVVRVAEEVWGSV